MKVVATNRRAGFDYEILEKFTAGVELTGHEAKSIKTRGVNIAGAHVIIRGEEAFVVGMDAQSFQSGNTPGDYDSQRTRRLLLKKGEIKHLMGKARSSLTIVPIKVYYTLRGLVKIEIAVARGRKKHDKREVLKKRDDVREMRKFKDKK